MGIINNIKELIHSFTSPNTELVYETMTDEAFRKEAIKSGLSLKDVETLEKTKGGVIISRRRGNKEKRSTNGLQRNNSEMQLENDISRDNKGIERE